MNNTTLLESVQYVIDAQGHKSAVLVNLDVWEQILTLVEDLEDAEELLRAKEQDEETIPWEKVKADLGLGG